MNKEFIQLITNLAHMDARTHKYTHAHTHTDKNISTYSVHVTSVHVLAATSDSQ